MFQALALCQSDWWGANPPNISLKTLYGGQFTLLLNYPVKSMACGFLLFIKYFVIILNESSYKIWKSMKGQN